MEAINNLPVEPLKPKPQTCEVCSPNVHLHEDHSYQSHIIEDDSEQEIVLHIYSCKICPCHHEQEGGTIEEFKQTLIDKGVLPAPKPKATPLKKG